MRQGERRQKNSGARRGHGFAQAAPGQNLVKCIPDEIYAARFAAGCQDIYHFLGNCRFPGRFSYTTMRRPALRGISVAAMGCSRVCVGVSGFLYLYFAVVMLWAGVLFRFFGNGLRGIRNNTMRRRKRYVQDIDRG